MKLPKRLVVSIIAIAAVVFMGGGLWIYHAKFSPAPLTFTPERWSAQPGQRYRMWGSFLEQYPALTGMTSMEIGALLGPDMYGTDDFDSCGSLTYAVQSTGIWSWNTIKLYFNENHFFFGADTFEYTD